MGVSTGVPVEPKRLGVEVPPLVLQCFITDCKKRKKGKVVVSPHSLVVIVAYLNHIQKFDHFRYHSRIVDDLSTQKFAIFKQ